MYMYQYQDRSDTKFKKNWIYTEIPIVTGQSKSLSFHIFIYMYERNTDTCIVKLITLEIDLGVYHLINMPRQWPKLTCRS
jgi:hypothetical protein